MQRKMLTRYSPLTAANLVPYPLLVMPLAKTTSWSFFIEEQGAEEKETGS